MIVLERKYPVNVYDTDHNGRLSLVALFNFLQDLAARHASLLGFGREHLMSNGYFWVLARITVEIEKIPFLWEEVTIRTWPRGTESLFALRDFDILDSNGQRLAGATSSWVVVDYKSRKVQRPDRALSHLNASFPEMRALTVNASKVPVVPDDRRRIKEITASTTDIDVNLHVNNANYVQWMCNCYEPEYLSDHIAATVEVNYLSEGHQGDVTEVVTAPENNDGSSMIHSVIRKADRAELCRIRIKWREVQV